MSKNLLNDKFRSKIGLTEFSALFLRPINKLSKINCEPSLVLDNLINAFSSNPNSSLNIWNAGIPLATNWFKEPILKPPWAPLANNLVKSFKASTLLVALPATLVNTSKSSVVGLTPFWLNVKNVLPTWLILNCVFLVKLFQLF